jgi:hypothetical protein
MFLLAGCDEKYGEMRPSGRNFPAAVDKNVAISIPLLRVASFLFIFIKRSKDQWKLIIILRGPSPFFAVSNHTTFSRSQSCATIPLNCPDENFVKWSLCGAVNPETNKQNSHFL